MPNRYFEINENGCTFEFKLLDAPDGHKIAEDIVGNSILLKDKSVYLFIHDAPFEKEYVKLLGDSIDFYDHLDIYDEEEQMKRLEKAQS